MTERNQSYSVFLESDAYRLLVENANEAIFVAQDGYIRYANPKTLELSGYSREELLSEPFAEKIHPEDRDMVVDRHVRRLKGEKFTDVYSYRIIDKKRNIIWLEMNVVMIMWWDKPASLNFASDITDRKRTEDALRESEELYRTLFHLAPVSVFSYDCEFKMLDCNEQMARLMGASRERLLGSNLRLVRDQRVVSSLTKPFEGEEGYYEGEYHTTLSGVELWVMVRTSPLRNGDGNIVGGIGMIQDMTDFYNAHKELTIKSRYLEEANTALRVFVRRREEERAKIQSDVVSNIRTLVLPYIEKMKMSRTDDDKQVFVELIESNINRVVSPFLREVSSYQLNLTPREIQIANLIRDGKSSKEIGLLLNISARSVEFYRSKIRNKLGLKGSKTNLRSQLLANT
ncbi:MAG TPA: PAS domain S-box protein [Deltaproteobacteria bacterium]|nr:PAS domain S-box protein [Deltaproteobacteria bacterium]